MFRVGAAYLFFTEPFLVERPPIAILKARRDPEALQSMTVNRGLLDLSHIALPIRAPPLKRPESGKRRISAAEPTFVLE